VGPSPALLGRGAGHRLHSPLPPTRPKGARLYKLPTPGNDLLFLLRSKTKTLLATGTTERVEGIVTEAAAYPLLKRQLNLEAFEAQAPKAFSLCP
jgi:hypothetical protein